MVLTDGEWDAQWALFVYPDDRDGNQSVLEHSLKIQIFLNLQQGYILINP